MYTSSNSSTNIITFLSKTLNFSKNFSLSKSFSSLSQRLSRLSIDPGVIGSIGSSEMEMTHIDVYNGKPDHNGSKTVPAGQSMRSFVQQQMQQNLSLQQLQSQQNLQSQQPQQKQKQPNAPYPPPHYLPLMPPQSSPRPRQGPYPPPQPLPNLLNGNNNNNYNSHNGMNNGYTTQNGTNNGYSTQNCTNNGLNNPYMSQSNLNNHNIHGDFATLDGLDQFDTLSDFHGANGDTLSDFQGANDTLSDFEGANDTLSDFQDFQDDHERLDGFDGSSHIPIGYGHNINNNTNNLTNNNNNNNNNNSGHLAQLLSTDQAQLAQFTNTSLNNHNNSSHHILLPNLPSIQPTQQQNITPPHTPHHTAMLNQSYSQHDGNGNDTLSHNVNNISNNQSLQTQSPNNPPSTAQSNQQSQQQQSIPTTTTLLTRQTSTFKHLESSNVGNKKAFDSNNSSQQGTESPRNTYEYAYINDETVQWNSKLTDSPAPLYGLQILTRLAAVLCLSQSLRTMCFLMTALPGPNYHCRPFTEFYSPPTSWSEILVRSDAFFSCGDLVFSSHTTFMVLFALVYTKYGASQKLKIAVWTFIVSFCALVLAARKHYTVDVLIACYTVPLLWAVFDLYCPDEIPVELARLELQEVAELMQN